MTEISLKESEKEVELLILGHCNAGRINGMDPCCCAVSMLVFTLLENLNHLKLMGYTGKYEGGWCAVRFRRKSPDYRDAMKTIDIIMKGFFLLMKTYPKNISINIKGGEKIE